MAVLITYVVICIAWINVIAPGSQPPWRLLVCLKLIYLARVWSQWAVPPGVVKPVWLLGCQPLQTMGTGCLSLAVQPALVVTLVARLEWATSGKPITVIPIDIFHGSLRARPRHVALPTLQ